MNNMKPSTTERGVILTDNVNLEWLKQVQPQYHSEFIKFVVNVDTNQMCVGMNYHKDSQILLAEDESPLYGGNIYFNDGHIVYESTLNIRKNIRLRSDNPDKRIITDCDTINQINATLLSWIEL